MKKANGHFKPAYTDPHHFLDDVMAPPVAFSNKQGSNTTKYIPDVKIQRFPQKDDNEQQHVADAPSSFSSTSSWPLSSSSSSLLLPNSNIRTKLNDDYHTGNKINVMPQQQRQQLEIGVEAQQKYFDGDDDDHVDDDGRSGKRTTKHTRRTGEDNKLNYAVCLRVIYIRFSRVNR